MQTSIDRSYRRTRRLIDSHPNIQELTKRLAWLSWPLIQWSGQAASPAVESASALRTLHTLIGDKLRGSPSGLYALQPIDGQSDALRLIAITGPRLAGAAHELALAGKGALGGTHHACEASAALPQMQSRLRLLARCLAGPATSSCESFPGRPARCDTVWLVSAGEVRPPSDMASLVHHYPEEALPFAGPAIMEFSLRAGRSTLSEFADGLRDLIAECHGMDAEPQRRRHIFYSLLKDVMRTQPAYLPAFYTSLTKGTITVWKANYAFLAEAVRLYLRDCLPPVASASLADETKTVCSFEYMCSRLVGMEWQPFKDRTSRSMRCQPNVTLSLVAALGELPVATAEARKSKLEFIGLAARCAALTGDAAVPRRFAVWLRTCRQFASLAKGIAGIWENASLRGWIEAANLEPKHLLRLSELLEARSVELLSYGWIRHREPPAALWALGKLGDLPLDDALKVVDFDLVDTAGTSFAGKSDQLAFFLRFVARHRRAWEQSRAWQQRTWVGLFAGMQNRRLPGQIHRWIEHLIVDRAFTFCDVTSFIWCIAGFLGENPASERPARESFISGRFPLLDRILDEVEATLSALPESGFDDWRSHAVLWRRRFGVCEVLYQWEAARLPEGAALVDRIFAWCRKREAAQIASRATEPSDYFNNVCGNETLAVRLAGGDSRRLLNLLDYYVERWNDPDHPVDGWRFLDRFSEAQCALQELCQKPDAFRFVVRTLRRLALALRLQCRPFLLCRLEEWCSACARPEPLERLRAFAALLGLSSPLPPAVKNLLGREQTLRRERDTLARMQAEGRISASALKRLTKLDQLLLDPSAIAQWVEKDVARAVVKMLPRLKASTLAFITREAVRSHWKAMVGRGAEIKGRDWDNALHFYYSADRNKELLRKLLHHVAGHDPKWRLQHSPNAKFLADLRAGGFDADAWLTPYSRTAMVHGETWTVRLVQDPLRVLQMGNLFGTCLSVDDCNAYAAIANAVEVNKQVLFLEDSGGCVIGRKLIGLTSTGRLFGFRSYGAACLDTIGHPAKPEVWIKILFDLACLDLVRRVKGQFDESPDLDTAADQLRLAADWYNDGPEIFDWWIMRPDLSEHVCHGVKAPVAEVVFGHLERHGLAGQDPLRNTMGTLRSLLWLGDEAAAIVEHFGPGFFPQKYRHYLRCQSSSARVQALLADHHD